MQKALETTLQPPNTWNYGQVIELHVQQRYCVMLWGGKGALEKACALYPRESVPNFEQHIKLNIIANKVEKALIS